MSAETRALHARPDLRPGKPKKKYRGAFIGKGDVTVEVVSIVVITLFAAICVAPFIYVLFSSLTPYTEYIEHPTRLIPLHPTLDAYTKIIKYNLIYTGYKVTISVTLLGTALSIFLLIITGYPLSKKGLKGANVIMGMIMFTMFFGGGMIPNYILIRDLNLTNTIGALILPGCMSAFNIILMKNFIRTTIPESLEEAARVDGANDLRILFQIITPLLIPIIATMVVFISVGHWNSYFNAMIYMRDRDKWPLMLVLREIVAQNTTVVESVAQMLNDEAQAHPFTLRMASIIVTTAPILIVYPFMQKYFVTGIHLGSVRE